MRVGGTLKSRELWCKGMLFGRRLPPAVPPIGIPVGRVAGPPDVAVGVVVGVPFDGLPSPDRIHPGGSGTRTFGPVIRIGGQWISVAGSSPCAQLPLLGHCLANIRCGLG